MFGKNRLSALTGLTMGLSVSGQRPRRRWQGRRQLRAHRQLRAAGRRPSHRISGNPATSSLNLAMHP